MKASGIWCDSTEDGFTDKVKRGADHNKQLKTPQDRDIEWMSMVNGMPVCFSIPGIWVYVFQMSGDMIGQCDKIVHAERLGSSVVIDFR